MIERVASGLLIGVIFGFFLQRGRFCFNSAFRDILLFKDRTLVKAIWVAVIIPLVGYQLLVDLGFLTIYPRGLYWAANIIGGFLFGVGMVVAGGCISGATYRTGEGLVGSMLALLGIGVGGAITLGLWLAPFKNTLQAMTKIQIAGATPTLPLALGLNPWFIILPIAIISLIFIQRGLRRENTNEISLFGSGWPWWLAGLTVGIVALIAYPVLELTGGTYPLGMTGGYVGLLATIVNLDANYISWETAMVLGAIGGAAIAAILAKEWKIRIPRPKLLAQSLLGGLLMGVGAVIGDGCNIATILIGIPLLSLGSILAGGFTILGCWTAALIMFR